MTSRYIPKSVTPSATLKIAAQFKHIPNFSKFWAQAQAKEPEFDWQFYLEYYSDLGYLTTHQEAYEHWVLFGQAENRQPNLAALIAYLEASQSELPSDFDAEGYRLLNPDLRGRITGRYKEYKATEHFLQRGRSEERAYKNDFDWRFYLEFYDDLPELSSYAEAYEHWLTVGYLEDRFTSPAAMAHSLQQRGSELPSDFNSEAYLKLNPDLQERFGRSRYRAELAINHFLQIGQAEGRPYYTQLTCASHEIASSALDLCRALSACSEYLQPASAIVQGQENPLVYFAHHEAHKNQASVDRLKAHPVFVNEAIAFYQAALQIQARSPDVIVRLGRCFETQKISSWTSACGRYECFDERYGQWLRENAPDGEQLCDMAKQIASWRYQPTISVIFPVYNTPAEFLKEALDSVINQIYPYWELCIADDRSTQPHVRQILEAYAAQDARIKVCFRETNGHISACSNSAIAIASGEFVTLLDHDDVITPDALYEAAKLLNQHPEADMIYSDEDKLTENGHLINPYFKPDWCPDAFLSRMYICHLGTYRRSLINQIGGFRLGYEGSQDYDLVLRLTEQTEQIYHIPKVLYHWRMHAESTAGSAAAKPYAYTAAIRAIESALQRRNEPGEVISHARFPGLHVIRYQIVRPGLISIIIPTKNLSAVLAKCLESIFTKSTYLNYEVIVIDNGSDEPELAELLLDWQSQYPEQFRFYSLDLPFNFSLINNYAVGKAQGDYLLFLNNDTEVITPDWLESLLEQAQRPSIGAVGPLLVYPDNSVQHAGVVMGIQGVANHGHRHAASELPGYFGQLATPNNYLAVTGACLLCRREVFLEVGGFDESLSVAYNDVDLCLKMIEKGYRNVFIPHAKLCHYESKSRGYEDSAEKKQRLQQESSIIAQRWEKYIEHDPCYSINLTRESENYDYRFAKTVSMKLQSVAYFESQLKRFDDFAIDDLEPGNIYRNFMLIRGWVLCQEAVVVGIELVSSQQQQFVPIDEVRADIANHRPDIVGAEYSGFRKVINFVDLTATELVLQAVLANGSRILFCKLQLEPVLNSNHEIS
ncbi:MAG: glycosyltransferase family 2 protein [Pegethrix bostrychoides GSE-TBD4-15B]|jgi:GT2 family glycosyltransferase|uniref:Glycosyltransferase family 2 protein n=1 Tax=Pegethrix bostrychoides GSE-TBD4-15B TaxID=2839662 RepID=A0A951PAN4_9CYAN|nr:glycosyltransferase family 2 protein [Pegethrix bostrychoides GSE-TBD4-15B]